MSGELRDEPPDSPASRALFDEYMGLVGERLGLAAAAAHAREDIFGSPSEFTGPGAVWLVLYLDGEPSGCGGLRPTGPGVAEVKRMFVTAEARGGGHGRALLRALESRAAAAGYERVRLITTEVLTEARALYAAEGYATVASPREGARQDYWMEKPLH
ncbi:MAG: hypothetical protein QOE28_1305 [Solirubrobacteraceae bacterium]|nr:hypothetical protein [Solirubrobacteraceae bacterium]